MGCPAVLYFSQMFIYMAPTGTAVQALDLPDLGLLQTIQDMRDSYTQTTAIRGLNRGVRSASKRRGNWALQFNELQKMNHCHLFWQHYEYRSVFFRFLQPKWSNSEQVHSPATQQLKLHLGGMFTVLYKQACHAVDHVILAVPPSSLPECSLGSWLAFSLPIPLS